MDYLAINQQTWDKRTSLHVESSFYDVEAFKAGKSSLNEIELKQLGDVHGKSLLHLQCHFGQDTLSWARLGAVVTGVDLSGEAINQAKRLRDTLGLPATFVQSDVIEFGKLNKTQFDLVYTSYGVLCWLADLNAWASTIANALTPGGEFHLVEFHPFNDVLAGHRYFPSANPDVEQEGTYTENCDGEQSTIVTWSHSISEVITALITAGLTIEAFTEHPFSPYDCVENAEYVEGQGYQKLNNGQQVPLIYAIKARKLR